MILIGYFIILIFTFLGMEIFSWAIHKYLMHGILWNIHQTHHQHKTNAKSSILEWNDVFSLFFGSVAIFFIIIGIQYAFWALFIGIGISLYGLVYFILHDGFIHQRFPFIRHSNNKIINAIRKAHYAHHKTHEKDGSESFGLLWVHKKYYQQK